MKNETLQESAKRAEHAVLSRMAGSSSMKKRKGRKMRKGRSNVSYSIVASASAVSASAVSASAKASKPPVKKQPKRQDEVVVRGAPVSGGRDLTTIPNELDAKYLKLDLDGTLRPTVI